MNNLQQFKQGHKGLAGLAGVLTLFVLVLIIFFIVLVFNGIKENRYIGQDIETRNTISISATGDIYVKPDLALMSFSVVTEAKTVVEAISQNSQNMNNVIRFIKDQGVEEKDLKTISFNIYPRYEYQRVQPEIYPYPPGKRILVGYEVSQSLEVKIRDLEKVGVIIEEATNAGANQIGNLQFTIDNTDEVKNQAREQAINEAKNKAKELAEQLGIKLKRIANFSESGTVPYFYGLEKSDLGMGGGDLTPAPQIEIGENKISVTVNITYEID